MIVGIVALFTVLFFGGGQEYFFIEKLEKGVKQYVVEKDRSKEILADLKGTKTLIKAFNKDRKGKLKAFLSMNIDPDVKRETLDLFFKDRVAERLIFQEQMIGERINALSKISDNEWAKIIALSDDAVDKASAKAQKKEPKDPFESVLKTIKSSIADQNTQSQAIALLQNFQGRYVDLLDKVNAVNTIESSLLQNKNTTAEEFQSLAIDVNRLRQTAYKALVDFHFDMKEITNEAEWVKVMKSLNKVII